jgi:hypothetical protein
VDRTLQRLLQRLLLPLVAEEMRLPVPQPPQLLLVKAERKSLPLPLQPLLVALTPAKALVALAARSRSHSSTTNARLVSALVLAKLALAINSSLSANISEFDMDFK